MPSLPEDLDVVIPAYEPAAEDWAEYVEWSRSIDGGVPLDALTLEEMELIVGTVSDREWRETLEDELADRRYADARYRNYPEEL